MLTDVRKQQSRWAIIRMPPSRIKELAVKSVAAFVIAAAVATAALGQTPPDDRKQRAAADLQKRFAAADANGDGKLTREEANGKMPRVYEHFDEIDKNKRGCVTIDDIRAFMVERRAEQKAAKQQP